MVIFLSILFIIVAVVQTNNQCPAQQTVYKYIPRTFEDEQNSPVYVSDIFRTMFSAPTPWAAGINQIDEHKQEVINKYFVSQI
jgi:hypothetical protein